MFAALAYGKDFSMASSSHAKQVKQERSLSAIYYYCSVENCNLIQGKDSKSVIKISIFSV
jgi:hypothetical protein